MGFTLALAAYSQTARAADDSALVSDDSREERVDSPSRSRVLAAREGTRFRLNLGTGVASFISVHPFPVPAGPLASFGLGVQVSQQFGIYARADLASLVVLNEGAAYLIAEWSPRPRWSFGSGFGVELHAIILSGGATGWGGLSMPIFVSYNFRPKDEPRADCWRLGLEASLGVQPSDVSFGSHQMLTIGYSWM